jgi:hypothetical protein
MEMGVCGKNREHLGLDVRSASISGVGAGDGDVGFASESGHGGERPKCRFCADFVVKIENRMTPKISRKQIFRDLYRYNAL